MVGDDADASVRPISHPDGQYAYVPDRFGDTLTVLDVEAFEVVERLDVGGSAFAGTWDPAHEKLYVPVQTADTVAVIDHASATVEARIPVGARPYGATAAKVRPQQKPSADIETLLASLGVERAAAETTYCIGNCACGHEL